MSRIGALSHEQFQTELSCERVGSWLGNGNPFNAITTERASGEAYLIKKSAKRQRGKQQPCEQKQTNEQWNAKHASWRHYHMSHQRRQAEAHDTTIGCPT